MNSNSLRVVTFLTAALGGGVVAIGTRYLFPDTLLFLITPFLWGVLSSIPLLFIRD